MTDKTIRDIARYCEAHTSPPHALLQELERETHLKTIAPQMLSGHLQGQLLRLLSRLLQPALVVEIGTFTGYSAICLAQGLAPGGVLHTIDIDPEFGYLARKYISLAGFENRIRMHLGRAQEIIPTLEGVFDLVFIDAGKQDYAEFYDLVIDRVRPGGLILADNVLWSGKVLNPKPGDDAAYLHAFNEKVHADPRVENLMLPVRDGLMIVSKSEVRSPKSE